MKVTYTRPENLNYTGCLVALVKFGCLIALAVHLGWSWWLLVLFIMVFRLNFTPALDD